MPPPPSPTPAATLAALRADLRRARYDVEHLEELLGEVAQAALHREQLLPARRALAGSTDPAAVLARIFVLGEPVPAPEVDRCLPRCGANGLVGLRLVTRQREDISATCDLRPYGQEGSTWWVASDTSELVTGQPLETDYVLGVGGASTTLASWTPRPQVGRALDLGTGCGVQALHLGEHAAYLVATDLSERALAFARFTAAVNGREWDLRAGSLLEPVAGETFELIVSNPPFVITPRVAGVPRYDYRDGGAAGDAIVSGLVADLGRHLAPGGIAQLLGNWEVRAGEDWRDPVGRWLEGTALDAWVVQRELQDPAQYAETWTRDGGQRPGTPAFEQLYGGWLDDFAARGVDRVGLGVITLHRPVVDRSPWRCLEDVRSPVATPMGPTVLAGIRARTWLAEHSEAELLGRSWQVAGDVTEERIGRQGAADPAVIRLRQGGGLRRTVQLDTFTAAVVGACDGKLTAAQLAHAVAALTGTDAARVIATVLPMLRQLVAGGQLIPPG